LANPQVENGHLKIANEVWDHLTSARLTGSEFQIILAVIRKTWGWNQKECPISLPEFQSVTRMPERTTVNSLNSLIGKNILICIKGGGRSNASKWSFNKNWELWKTLPPVAGIKVGEINPAKFYPAIHGSQTLPPVAGISAENGRVSPCNLLPGMEQLAPKATFKAIKDTRASKEAPSSDERLKDLKKFISEEFHRIRGFKLITDSSDWTKLSSLLKSTKDDSVFCLEKLQRAWTNFLGSEDEFHQKQGHPLRYWASNINAFIGGVRHRNGSKEHETDMQKLAREKREKLDAMQKNT